MPLPSLGHVADTIGHEQTPLLAELDQIISRLRDARDSVKATDDLRQAFVQFAQKLHAHEEAENSLLESAFGIPVE